MPKHTGPQPYLSTIRNTTPRWGDYAHLAKTLSLKKNEVLLYAGQIPGYLYYLVSGELCFKFIDMEGREQYIQYLGEKSLVGETFFILGCPLRTTVVCTKAAVLLGFTREQALIELLPNDPALLQDLLASLAHKTMFNTSRRLIESSDSIQVRICNIFLQYAQRNAQGELIIKLPYNYNDLSCSWGMHRVTLYRAIKELQSKGVWKKLHIGEFRVLDEKLLESIALNTSVAN